MAGFDTWGNVSYFLGVVPAIEALGYRAFAIKLDPFNSIEQRAIQAAAQIDEILERTGAAKVHVIGHSQGGLDARYLVSHFGYGDRIASVTTIGTPHRGTVIVDAALGYAGNQTAAALIALGNALVGAATHTRADLEAQLVGLSRRYVIGTFNPHNLDDPSVSYYSFSGVTHAQWSSGAGRDIVNPLLAASHLVLTHLAGRNDGMVPEQSARWGTYLGALPADHMDEIGHNLGVGASVFDHREFYADLARFLNGAGPAPIYEDERARGTRAVRIGDLYRVQHTFTGVEVEEYADLVDMESPQYSVENPEGEVMVHPTLVTSLVTRFVGQLDFVSRKSELVFGEPVYTGEMVSCEVRLTDVEPRGRRAEVTAEASCRGRADRPILDATVSGLLVWPQSDSPEGLEPAESSVPDSDQR